MITLMNKHVIYSNETERAYIYLTEPLTQQVSETEELLENDDIIIDLGVKVPIVGIEIEGETAKKLKYIPDKNKFFIEKETDNKSSCYSLRLNDADIKKTIKHKNVPNTEFHFADEDCLNFIGIDITDDSAYYKKYLGK